MTLSGVFILIAFTAIMGVLVTKLFYLLKCATKAPKKFTPYELKRGRYTIHPTTKYKSQFNERTNKEFDLKRQKD